MSEQEHDAGPDPVTTALGAAEAGLRVATDPGTATGGQPGDVYDQLGEFVEIVRRSSAVAARLSGAADRLVDLPGLFHDDAGDPAGAAQRAGLELADVRAALSGLVAALDRAHNELGHLGLDYGRADR